MVCQEVTREPEAPDPKLVALQAAACLIHMCQARSNKSQWEYRDEIAFQSWRYIGVIHIDEMMEAFAKTIYSYVRRVAGVLQAQPLHQLKETEARLLTDALNAYDLWYCAQRRRRVTNGEDLPPRIDWTKYNDRLMAGCVLV